MQIGLVAGAGGALVGAALRAWWGREVPPSGVRGDWRYEHQGPKKNAEGTVTVGLACDVPFSFVARAEGAWDRWFKGPRGTVEPTTGDPGFDAQVFVVADEPEVGRALTRDDDLRGAIAELVALGARVQCRAGVVWARRSSRAVGADPEASWLAAQDLCAPLLRVAEGLRAAAHGRRWAGDPPRAKGARAWLVAGAACAGFGLLSWAGEVGVGLPANAPGILPMALVAGLVVWALAFGGAWAWFRGTARFHLVVGELLLTVGLSAVPASFGLLSGLNRALDPSKVQVQSVKVLAKEVRRTTHKGRTTLHYEVTLDDWSGVPSDTWELSEAAWSALPEPGGVVKVRTYAGFLGVPWVESVAP